MRADRLISIMLLLQARGRMTAQDLAGELEVSQRTIYRDIQALSTSGVPIYAEHGPGGGLALLDSYRTNLTGLNEDELRALFMVFSVPEPLNRLGIGRELKSAFAKLSAALPGSQRASEEKVRQRFLLDWNWWQHTHEPVPHLTLIQQAIWEDRRLRLLYNTFRLYPTQVDIDPYGLVAKAGAWYLVASLEGSMRAYQLTRLTDVIAIDRHFDRRDDFNLAAFWQEWCTEYEEHQSGFTAQLRISPGLLKYLPLYFGHQVTDLISRSGPADQSGWVTITLSFESLDAARDRILDLGGAAEVLEPIALRMSVADYAAQILNRYTA